MLDVVATIERLEHELRTQDNCCTAHPIFMVQERRRQYGLDLDYCERRCFLYSDDSDIEVNEESDPVRFAAFRDGRFGDDDPEAWTETGYVDNWHNIQPFLTRAAAQEYIDTQHHRHRPLQIYVDSAYRNPEWQLLRELFGSGILRRMLGSAPMAEETAHVG